MSPNSTTKGSSRPGSHTGRIIDWHADNPAMKCAAVAEMARIRHVNHVIDQPKCSALVLDRRSKSHAVISSFGIYIYWPAGIGRPRVYIYLKNEMLLDHAIDHC